MTDKEKLGVITSWLTRLRDLTITGRQDRDQVKDQLALYATMLAEDIDVGAFTMRSLGSVAGECKFWPAYGELKPLLSAWWRDHRPLPTMICAPTPVASAPQGRPERTAEEIEYVTSRVKMAIGAMRGHRTAVDAAVTTSPPKPARLSPEQLAALRDADPKVQAARAMQERIKAQ
jgi:hypothetical protein